MLKTKPVPEKKAFLSLFILLSAFSGLAQNDVYIASSGTLYTFHNLNIASFGNINTVTVGHLNYNSIGKLFLCKRNARDVMQKK